MFFFMVFVKTLWIYLYRSKNNKQYADLFSIIYSIEMERNESFEKSYKWSTSFLSLLLWILYVKVHIKCSYSMLLVYARLAIKNTVYAPPLFSFFDSFQTFFEVLWK